jgi:outer membrane biosynthesis protein TonB
MPGKIWAIFAIIAVLALCGCAEQGTQNQTAPPETPVETAPPVGEIQQPRRQDETGATETPEIQPPEEPVPEEPEIQPLPEEPTEEPGAPQQVPGFEAYLALGAIGLAGAAVALTHRKKKE